MKKILVPTDFSPQATEAFKFAVDLGSITGMDILVVHSINLPVVAAGFDVQPYIYTPELNKELETIARESFSKMVSGYPNSVRSTLVIKFNSVLDAVLDVMTKEDIEVVVMGTKGSSGFEEIVWGSNTERVVRFSPVPVIAIRQSPNLKSISHILFPNNLALDQSPLVERVKNLQSFFDAKLHILWVNTPAHFVPDSEIKEKLREFVIHYHISNYALAIRNDVSEEAGIASYVKDYQPDMIAMGTRGKRGLAHFFSGRIAEDVVNHIQCPVWTYSTHK